MTFYYEDVTNRLRPDGPGYEKRRSEAFATAAACLLALNADTRGWTAIYRNGDNITREALERAAREPSPCPSKRMPSGRTAQRGPRP